MLVYRIATETDGKKYPIGPYQWGGGEDLDYMCQVHTDSKHPTPNRDGLGWMEGHEFCGFKSMRSLNRWFNGFHEVLRNEGFKLYIYEVEQQFVRIGRRQVVFSLDYAKLVERKKIKIPKPKDTDMIYFLPSRNHEPPDPIGPPQPSFSPSAALLKLLLAA